MQNNSKLQGVLKSQFPTIIGIVILIIALVIGLVAFAGGGLGIFSPRAAPETTPKNIKLTNVTDSGFTVSFLTDEPVSGFITYGTTPDKIESQASDDRDQLTGSVGEFTTHHITVRGLQPATPYHYLLGTGSNAEFDNAGAPFQITTAAREGVPTAAKTTFGSVTTAAGSPAEGSIVYITLEGIGELSTLVKDSGSWAIPLSNARDSQNGKYATVSDSDVMTVTAQGISTTTVGQVSTTVSNAQPVKEIVFGTTPAVATTVETVEMVAETVSTTSTSTESAQQTTQSKSSGGLTELVASTTSTDETTILDLSDSSIASDSAITVTTTQPKIIGTVAPQVLVSIEINSTNQIIQTVSSDANGTFELDLAEISEELEAGAHTITYSYTDPTTGEEVTKTQAFTVVKSSTTLASSSTQNSGIGGLTSDSQLLAQAQPFGSGNPFPGDATSSTTATDSGSSKGGATDSGKVSLPSTSSGIPKSGSVGATIALVIGGIFFIGAGGWSYWLALQVEEAHAQQDN